MARKIIRRMIIAMTWFYLAGLFAWLAAYLLRGDQPGLLGVLNLAAVYFFAPLPLVLVAALAYRSPALGTGFIAGLGVFLWLWGGQLLPRQTLFRTPSAQAAGPTLTVMTYNVLAHHRQVDPILETIRAEGADVVLIQELNLTLAQALQERLRSEYPYQELEATNNPTGIGVISKYPLRPTGDRLPQRWIGGPQLLELEWEGQAVRLVNFHFLSTVRLQPWEALSRDFRDREEQARLLVDYVCPAGPALLGGDANSGPLSDAHRVLSSELTDAWEAGGLGLGHTFPGAATPGGNRPKIGAWYSPRWLARIDYLFASRDWVVLWARTARIDGVSDHRGVVAAFRLKGGALPGH